MEQQKHLDQAADWFDRFDELDEKGKIALSDWLSEEQHQIAFQRIAQAFGQPEVAQAAINVAANRCDDTNLKNDSAANEKPRQPYVSYWAMAASFVAVAVLVAYLRLNQPTPPSPGIVDNTVPLLAQTMQLSSSKAQRISQVLNDGSAVHLNGDSQLSVNHNATFREVDLRKGQAYFDVAHEPSRPFIVNVDKVKVQVVGTAFDIDKLSDKTVIRVYDGIVKIIADKTHTLIKGEGIVLENNLWSQTFRLTDEQLPAWRSGWLDIFNEPLYLTVERFSRYLQKPVEINVDKDALLTGRFNLSEPEAALQLLASAQGLTLEEHQDRFVLTDTAR